ncbi:MAG: alpha/beta hydrolase [Rhodocyclaceae bacterium]|nr:alpha/beta hydrolase [Rhodocyclaceae bacterium]
MTATAPFCREAGSGPGVVCLHSNASSSGQWRSLVDELADRYRVLAPDSYGAGKSPEWPSRRQISLGDEAALIEPVLARAGSPLALIGHSYGGAVALIAALARPQRVRALVLYEPTLFALVDVETPPPNGADGIRNTVEIAAQALDRDDRVAAARCFIDFWMAPGSFDAMPDGRRAPIADSVVNIRRWAHALLTEPTPLAAFAALDMPVLYLLGARSPEPAHAVARVLIPALPRVEVVELPEVGHMAPITHPGVVNGEIARFLARTHAPT